MPEATNGMNRAGTLYTNILPFFAISFINLVTLTIEAIVSPEQSCLAQEKRSEEKSKNSYPSFMESLLSYPLLPSLLPSLTGVKEIAASSTQGPYKCLSVVAPRSCGNRSGH